MNYEYTYVLLSLLKMQVGILSLFIDKILVVQVHHNYSDVHQLNLV